MKQRNEWDFGATGIANRERLIEEEATELDPRTGKKQPNPNNVRRVRRHSWIEIYFRKGKLSKDQLAAAIVLHSAFTGKVARDPLAAIGEIVDGSKCDDPMVLAVDAKRLFFAMWEKIPKRCRHVIEHVVLHDNSLRSIPGCHDGRKELVFAERLRDGLDAIS